MSVEEQFPCLSKLYSFYEEIGPEILDGTDVDSNVHRNIFDISQSQHRIVRVSKCSNRFLFAIKLFQSFDLKTQQRYILREQVNISRRTQFCWSTDCAITSKLLTKRASVYKFHHRNPNLRLNLQKQKTIPLFIILTITLNVQKDKFVCHSD